MDKDKVVNTLQNKLREDMEDTPENVHYIITKGSSVPLLK
jgi:hypothetical protein